MAWDGMAWDEGFKATLNTRMEAGMKFPLALLQAEGSTSRDLRAGSRAGKRVEVFS